MAARTLRQEKEEEAPRKKKGNDRLGLSEEEDVPGKNASIDIWLKAIDALKVDLNDLLTKLAKEPKPDEKPDKPADGPSMFDVLKSAEDDKDKKGKDKKDDKLPTKPPVDTDLPEEEPEEDEDEPVIPLPSKSLPQSMRY